MTRMDISRTLNRVLNLFLEDYVNPDEKSAVQAYNFQWKLSRKTMQSHMRECKLYVIILFIYFKIVKMIDISVEIREMTNIRKYAIFYSM